ncbi:hypothetical protein CBS101457_003565 [Exobasidium rhododendri]|nr:hypothetical protein CBS101457_003565 [Exobasidium rhododendri]
MTAYRQLSKKPGSFSFKCPDTPSRRDNYIQSSSMSSTLEWKALDPKGQYCYYFALSGEANHTETQLRYMKRASFTSSTSNSDSHSHSDQSSHASRILGAASTSYPKYSPHYKLHRYPELYSLAYNLACREEQADVSSLEIELVDVEKNEWRFRLPHAGFAQWRTLTMQNGRLSKSEQQEAFQAELQAVPAPSKEYAARAKPIYAALRKMFRAQYWKSVDPELAREKTLSSNQYAKAWRELHAEKAREAVRRHRERKKGIARINTTQSFDRSVGDIGRSIKNVRLGGPSRTEVAVKRPRGKAAKEEPSVCPSAEEKWKQITSEVLGPAIRGKQSSETERSSFHDGTNCFPLQYRAEQAAVPAQTASASKWRMSSAAEKQKGKMQDRYPLDFDLNEECEDDFSG